MDREREREIERERERERERTGRWMSAKECVRADCRATQSSWRDASLQMLVISKHKPSKERYREIQSESE